MRMIPLLVLLLLVGCQSTTGETDRNAKPKKCDARAIESGLCVPGTYDDIY